jgi:hypothetical protein
MIGARPRPGRHLPDADPFALRVFVPGIMGTGLLVSLVVLVHDAVRRVSRGQTHRRHAGVAANHVAAAAAAATGTTEPPRLDVGLHSRRTYGLLAAAFLSGGMYTLVGSFWNFVDVPWASDIAWIWAVSMIIGLSLNWIGAAAAAVMLCWPTPPAFVWPLIRRTPLGADVKRSSGG